MAERSAQNTVGNVHDFRCIHGVRVSNRANDAERDLRTRVRQCLEHMLINAQEGQRKGPRARMLQILGIKFICRRSIKHCERRLTAHMSVAVVRPCTRRRVSQGRSGLRKDAGQGGDRTAVTKGKDKETWRVEPEGEAERPKATAPWNEAERASRDESRKVEAASVSRRPVLKSATPGPAR